MRREGRRRGLATLSEAILSALRLLAGPPARHSHRPLLQLAALLGTLALVVGLGFLPTFSPTPAAAQTSSTLYGVNSADDGLSIIDPATGQVTFIDRLHPDTTKFTTPIAMAVRPSDQKLFVWNNSDPAGVLLTVDTSTGRGTQINASASGVSLAALAFAPDGTLYGLDTRLYRIDTTTGVPTLVGDIGPRIGGADFDPASGTLYGLELTTNSSQRLFTLDTTTGATTLVATLSANVGVIGSIVFTPGCALLGSSLTENALFDLDKSTGAVSNPRNFSGGSTPQGMGFAPPCSDTTPPSITGVSDSPDPFSPNGDNSKDTTTISFSLDEAATVTIKIHNASGTLVRTLVNAASLASGAHNVVWDGLNDAGTSLAEGSYTYNIEARDEAGNTATPVSGTVTVDTTPPTISNVSDSVDPFSPNGDGVKDTTRISYTLSEASFVQVEVFNASGSSVRMLVSQDQSAGDHGVTWNGKNQTGGDLPDGTYTYKIRASDAAGNMSAASTALTVTIDTVPPTSTITFPVDGAVYNSAGWDSGCGTAAGDTCGTSADNTGGSGLERVEVSIKRNSDGRWWDGGAFASPTEVFFNTAEIVLLDTGTTAWNLSFPASNFPSDGSYTVRARGVDVAGNVEASPTATFSIDNTPPPAPSTPDLDAASDTGTSSTDDITKDNRPTLIGTAEFGSTVKIFSGTTLVGSGTASSTGTYSITTSTLTGGVHSITATATDPVGNTSTPSGALSVTIDTTPPSAPSTPDLDAASDTGRSDTDNITNDKTPTVTGTAEFSSLVELLADGPADPLSPSITLEFVGSGTASSTGAWDITSQALDDGAYGIRARQTDLAGNVSDFSVGLSITIDTVAPPPPGSASVSGLNTTTQTWTVLAEADSLVKVKDCATSPATVHGSAIAEGGVASITTNLASGTYQICITATDTAGNESDPLGNVLDLAGKTTGGGTVTVDDSSLTVSISGPSSTSLLPIKFAVTFSKIAYGFGGELSLSGCSGTLVQTVKPLDTGTVFPDPSKSYELAVSGITANCTLSAAVPASVAADVNGTANSMSSTVSVAYTHTPDLTAPTTTITGSPRNPSSPKVSFAFTSNKEGSTFECSLDGAGFTPCRSPQQHDNLSTGSHTFDVRATSVYGVTGSPASFTWNVNPDADGDGLLDEWESATPPGATIDGAFVPLPLASATQQNVYLHIDRMAPGGTSCQPHRPSVAALQKVHDAFLARDIKLVVDAGPGSPIDLANPTGAKWGDPGQPASNSLEHAHQEVVGAMADSRYDWSAVDSLKNASGGFNASKRKGLYHYVGWFHKYETTGSSGISRGAPASDFLVTLGTRSPNTCTTGVKFEGSGTVDEQAGTLIHELGHNLGLFHGGNEPTNKKPNYISSMNYPFQFGGVPKKDASGNFVGVPDFSDADRSRLPAMDERNLTETTPLKPPATDTGATNAAANHGTKSTCSSGSTLSINPLDGNINWDCDSTTGESGVDTDTNSDTLRNTPDVCITAGPNGKLDTPANWNALSGDDRFFGTLAIVSGANRLCDTLALGDDVQVKAVGASAEILLAGHDDWGNLKLKGGEIGEPGFTAPPQKTLAEDLDDSEALRYVFDFSKFWDFQPGDPNNNFPRTSGATVSAKIFTTQSPRLATFVAAAARLGPEAAPPIGTSTSADGNLVLTFDAAATGYTGGEICITGRTATESAKACAPAVWPNAAPTADARGPYSGEEGSPITFEGSGSDPDLGTIGEFLTYIWDFGDGTRLASLTPKVTHTYQDSGTFTVTLTVRDSAGETASSTTTAAVANKPPTVGTITGAPVDPNAVGITVTVSATFSDPGAADTHTAIWDWGDGTTSAGTVSEADGSGSVTGSHTYTAAGVFRIKLTVTDDDGGTGQAPPFEFVVVYDPTAGFVTGGGWIDSKAGACLSHCGSTLVTGKANLGFVSKYKGETTVPEGETKFQFKNGNLNFHSTSYEWLVVSGARAKYKGTGTLNGQTGYGFEVIVNDGQQPNGGGVDEFRMRITDPGGAVVYDNVDPLAPSSALQLDEALLQEIGGGSIVIHTQ